MSGWPHRRVLALAVAVASPLFATAFSFTLAIANRNVVPAGLPYEVFAIAYPANAALATAGAAFGATVVRDTRRYRLFLACLFGGMGLAFHAAALCAGAGAMESAGL